MGISLPHPLSFSDGYVYDPEIRGSQYRFLATGEDAQRVYNSGTRALNLLCDRFDPRHLSYSDWFYHKEGNDKCRSRGYSLCGLGHLHSRHLIYLLLLRRRSRRCVLLLAVDLSRELASVLCNTISGKTVTAEVLNGLRRGWACRVVAA